MNDYNVKLISNDNKVMESDGHFVPNGSEKDTKKPHENNLHPNEDNIQPKGIPSQPVVVTPAPQIQNTAQTTPLISNNIPTSTPVPINQPVIAQTPTNPSKHNIEEPTEEVTDEGEEENGSHGDHMDISDELFAEIQKDDSLKIYDKNNRILSESDNGDRLIWLAEDIGTRFYHPGKDDELNIIKTTKGKCLKRIKNGVFLRDCDKAGDDPSFLFRMNLSERGMRPKKSPKAKDKDEEENSKEKSEETKKKKPKKKIHKNHDISAPEEENLSDTEDLEVKNKKDPPHKELLDSSPNPTLYALPYFLDRLTETTSELNRIKEKIGNNCHKENNKEGEVLNSVLKKLELIEDHLKKSEKEKDSKKAKNHSSSNNDEEENEKNKEKSFDSDKMLKIISDFSSRITNTLPPSQPAYNPPPNNQQQPMNNQPYTNQPQPVYNQPYNNQQQPMNNQPYTNQPPPMNNQPYTNQPPPMNNQPYTNQPQQNQNTPNNPQQSSPPPSNTTNPLDLISQIIKLSPSNQASSFINSMNQNKNPNNIIG